LEISHHFQAIYNIFENLAGPLFHHQMKHLYFTMIRQQAISASLPHQLIRELSSYKLQETGQQKFVRLETFVGFVQIELYD
jgi:hypothetical protein